VNGAERLGFALACCVGALSLFAGALVGLGEPLSPIAPPRDQTPIAWATAAPTPTVRPFAAHGTPRPWAPVNDRVFCAGSSPRCPTDAETLAGYGSLTSIGTGNSR
jgi:hypothetical protein